MDNEFEEEIREFLIESNENLARLDQQIVQLEQHPHNHELISGVFRTIHSVKGTCGFFGFDILGAVTHVTESILGQLREGKRELTPELITLILEAVDAVKTLLGRIETTGSEGEDETEALRERLEVAYREGGAARTIPQMLSELKSGQENGIASATPVETAGLPAGSAPAAVVAPAAIVLPGAIAAPGAMAAPAAIVAPVPEPANTVVAVPPGNLIELPAAAPAKVAAAVAAAGSEGSGDAHLADSTIRVDVGLLNRLMNLVGELVLTRNQLLQSAGSFSSGLQQTSQRLNIITTELQEGVMKTRMQPIGVVWSKLPRVVRDLSAKCGKQIHLEMSGAETELDKSLIEAIRDPLTHIVRNSCDHGIETPAERLAKGKLATGTLSLRAFHEAGAVNIEIVDDGAGIDPERVRAKAVEKHLITPEHAATLTAAESIHLIFLPGFSTAPQVTSISGRGVGMDVVKTNIEKISGSVQIVRPPGGGTCLRIKIPLTLAIIPGLIVASRSPEEGVTDERFVIPQSHLVEMTRVDMSSSSRMVEKIDGALIFRHRGNLLPLISLGTLLYGMAPPAAEEWINIIILQVQGKQFGLVVDSICDTQEIVVKPLGKQLKQLACYGGATIMGDGRPALILDVGGIARLAELDAQHKERVASQPEARQEKVATEFILFLAGKGRRMALPLTIVNRLEKLQAAAVEYAAGQPVVRYRGELLPLVDTAGITGEPFSLSRDGQTVSVIVIHNGSQAFGLIVDVILDVVEESLSAVRGSAQPGLLGSAVIDGHVTDIVDATALCEGFAKSWTRATETAAYTRRIGYYNPWPLGAEMLRTLLDAAGYIPVRIGSAAELKQAVLRTGGELNALMLDYAAGDPLPEWLRLARTETGPLHGVPLIELADSARTPEGSDLARVAVSRHDRPGILRALARVMPAEKGKAA